MHYQNPRENQIAYVLEGFDKNWHYIPASDEYINFNNIPHGTYMLRIRGSNSDNIWSEDIKQLEIVVLPRWYQTWWAKLVFALLVVFLLSGVMILILHRQSLKHLLKIEKIEKENLKELNEEKLRFFTNISHELRTPLTLTIAPIEDLIQQDELEEKYLRKQLNLAHRNAKILIRLINQIIDIRRLNAGKLNLEAAQQDLSILLREVVNNFEAFKTDKNIKLSLELGNRPFTFSYDAQKMEQIINNLLSNAFKFTPDRGAIRISIKRSTHNFGKDELEPCVELLVFNEGKEIPEDQLENIFTRFHKIDSSSEGSGIGLSFTRSLVELTMDRSLQNQFRVKVFSSEY